MGPGQHTLPLRAFHNVVRAVAQIPILFDGARWGLEGGFRKHRELIRRHFPHSPTRVLDCGCGTGLYARHFSQQSYVGIDLSIPYLQKAKHRNPNYRFKVMDATALDFESSSFDAVITSGLIHHLEDDKALKVLAEIRRILKTSGRFLIWEDIPTQKRFNPIGRLVQALDQGHFIRSESEYLALLQGNFQTESVDKFQSGFMDYAVFLCRPNEREST